MRKLLQELAECERMMKLAEEKPSTTPPTAQETPSGTTLPPPPSTPPAAAPPAEEQAAEGASKENIDKFNALYTAKGGVIPEVLDPSKAPKDQWYNDPRVQQKALWSTGIGLATALGGYALTGGRGGIAPWLLGGLGIGGGIGGMLGYKDWTDAAEQYKKNSEQWKAYNQALGEYEQMLAEEREALKPVLTVRNTPTSQRVDESAVYEPKLSYTEKGTEEGRRLRGEAWMRKIERERHNLNYDYQKERAELENRTDLDEDTKKARRIELRNIYNPRFEKLQADYSKALLLYEGGTPTVNEMYYGGAAGWHPGIAWLPGSLNWLVGATMGTGEKIADGVEEIWNPNSDTIPFVGWGVPESVYRHARDPESGKSIEAYRAQSPTHTGSTQFTDRGRQEFLRMSAEGLSMREITDRLSQMEQTNPGTYYSPEAYFNTHNIPQEQIDNLIYDENGDPLPFRQAYDALDAYLENSHR